MNRNKRNGKKNGKTDISYKTIMNNKTLTEFLCFMKKGKDKKKLA